MTKEEIEQNKIIQFCYSKLKHFVDIYPKEGAAKGFKWTNSMPHNVKLTVFFCKNSNSDEEGFLIYVTTDETGLQGLIAQKWIIHEHLELLAGREIR